MEAVYCYFVIGTVDGTVVLDVTSRMMLPVVVI